MCDQWYINYGLDQDRNQLLKYVVSDNFNSYNENLIQCYKDALNWLQQWGCSRSFGLGTKIPWDKQYLVESLSDSTIYMAFYTVAHFLQSSLDGSKTGTLEIKAEDLTE